MYGLRLHSQPVSGQSAAFVQTREQKPRSCPLLSVKRTHLFSLHSELSVQSSPSAFVPVPPELLVLLLVLDVELVELVELVDPLEEDPPEEDPPEEEPPLLELVDPPLSSDPHAAVSERRPSPTAKTDAVSARRCMTGKSPLRRLRDRGALL